jgi:hypothetical protein
MKRLCGALLLLVTPPLSARAGSPEACDARALSRQGPEELKRTRNAVYARHGRTFTSPELRASFEQQPWYRADPGYSDARLTPADKACVARVGLFERGKPVWSQEADLDGDGAAEGIFLFDARPAVPSPDSSEPCENCSVTLLVHETVRELRVGWKRGSYFGEVRAQVMDLDAGDRRKELIVSHRAPLHEDPPEVHDVLSWGSGSLQGSRVEGQGYDGGKVTVRGDGLLRLEDQTCVGDRTRRLERRYALRQGKLVPTGEQVLSETPGCAG